MIPGQEKRGMTTEEIKELIELREWRRRDLAQQLDVSEAAVFKWLREETKVRGPAGVLMRMLLDEARKEASKKTVPA